MDSRQNGRSGLDIGLWPEKLRMIIAKDEMYGSFFPFFFFHNINREGIVWRDDFSTCIGIKDRRIHETLNFFTKKERKRNAKGNVKFQKVVYELPRGNKESKCS